MPFLERIFARRIGNLREGRGRYAIACTPDGGTFMDGILFKMEENRFWYVQPDGALEAWLIAHSDGFEIKISDPESRVLQIQGPNSMKIMADATAGAIDESMKYFDSGFYDIGGQELYVSRTGWTGELGYEVYSA
ncbi:MAG: aminomethyl transferase family protein, partial [Gammaproteobacteria bacterium]